MGRCSGESCNGRDARCPLCGMRDGTWPPEFERILTGDRATMLAQDAWLGNL